MIKTIWKQPCEQKPSYKVQKRERKQGLNSCSFIKMKNFNADCWNYRQEANFINGSGVAEIKQKEQHCETQENRRQNAKPKFFNQKSQIQTQSQPFPSLSKNHPVRTLTIDSQIGVESTKLIPRKKKTYDQSRNCPKTDSADHNPTALANRQNQTQSSFSKKDSTAEVKTVTSHQNIKLPAIGGGGKTCDLLDCYTIDEEPINWKKEQFEVGAKLINFNRFKNNKSHLENPTKMRKQTDQNCQSQISRSRKMSDHKKQQFGHKNNEMEKCKVTERNKAQTNNPQNAENLEEQYREQQVLNKKQQRSESSSSKTTGDNLPKIEVYDKKMKIGGSKKHRSQENKIRSMLLKTLQRTTKRQYVGEMGSSQHKYQHHNNSPSLNRKSLSRNSKESSSEPTSRHPNNKKIRPRLKLEEKQGQKHDSSNQNEDQKSEQFKKLRIREQLAKGKKGGFSNSAYTKNKLILSYVKEEEEKRNNQRLKTLVEEKSSEQSSMNSKELSQNQIATKNQLENSHISPQSQRQQNQYEREEKQKISEKIVIRRRKVKKNVQPKKTEDRQSKPSNKL